MLGCSSLHDNEYDHDDHNAGTISMGAVVAVDDMHTNMRWRPTIQKVKRIQ